MGRFAEEGGEALEEVGKRGGLLGALEPGGPIGFGGDFEFLAPPVQVEPYLGFLFFVGEGIDGVIRGVGGSTRIGVEVGAFGYVGFDGVLLNVE